MGGKNMNNLIRVDYSSERPTVSARELHRFLEIKTEFRHWFPRMCEYGFTEGIDYTPVILTTPKTNSRQKTIN